MAEDKLFELTFERGEVNLEKLHQELKASLGESLVGVSTGGGAVRVHLSREESELSELIGQVVSSHKPDTLTDEQKKEADRQTLIDALKKTPVALWTAEQKDQALRVLWEMVAE